MDLYTLFLKKLYLPIRRNTYGETQQEKNVSINFITCSKSVIMTSVQSRSLPSDLYFNLVLNRIFFWNNSKDYISDISPHLLCLQQSHLNQIVMLCLLCARFPWISALEFDLCLILAVWREERDKMIGITVYSTIARLQNFW